LTQFRALSTGVIILSSIKSFFDHGVIRMRDEESCEHWDLTWQKLECGLKKLKINSKEIYERLQNGNYDTILRYPDTIRSIQ